MRVWVITAALVGGLLAGAEVSGKVVAASVSPDSLVLLASSDISWTPGSRPGFARAPLWGDRRTGPYGEFQRYDGGYQLPLHFHSNELRGLIISGTWVIEVRGQAAKELPAGSYFSVPGKTQHVDTCKSGAVCVLHLTGELPLDLIPVTPD